MISKVKTLVFCEDFGEIYGLSYHQFSKKIKCYGYPCHWTNTFNRIVLHYNQKLINEQKLVQSDPISCPQTKWEVTETNTRQITKSI